MSPPPSTAWDTLPLRYTTLNEAYITPPQTLESLRADRRTRPYERYLELLTLGIEDERRNIELRSLAQETAHRLSHWGARHTRVFAPGLRAGSHGDLFEVRFSVARVALVLVGAVVVGALALWYSWAGMGLAAALAAALALFARRMARTVAAAEILRRRHCPDCGYRLSDLRPAIPEADLGGLWCGPRACPECGGPWPMIPPPVIRD